MSYVGITEKGSVPELSSVALNVNGKLIDKEIKGYRTLKVSGRETISNQLESVETKEGALIVDERLPARELKITYAMRAKNNKDLQQQFKELRKLLTGDLKISFVDESGTFYWGKLSSMEVPPDHTHNLVSEFIIYCPSPFKYGPLEVTSGSVNIDTFYQPTPERIELSIPTTTNNILITNGTYEIKANGTFNAGSEVVLDFNKEDMRLLVNGVDSTYMLAMNSDLENFKLKQGQSLRSEQGSLQVYMRERWL